jgi:hypothetical protein
MRFLAEMYRIDPETGVRVYDEGVFSRPKGRAKSEVAGFIAVAEALSMWCASTAGTPTGSRSGAGYVAAAQVPRHRGIAGGQHLRERRLHRRRVGPGRAPRDLRGHQGRQAVPEATALYLPHGGEIRASTAGSASKDGGKETFVVADETHLYVLRELKAMYGTVRRNLGKRKIAQPWLLQTSTAYRPGEQSIFEETLTAWRKKELAPTVHVDHREAKGRIDIRDENHTMKQLRYVYGAASEWMDLDRIYREMLDPRSCPDDATAARYFLNRPMSTVDAWIAKDVAERQVRKGDVVAAGEAITLGFDGSLNDDTTVLRGCRMSDGFRFRIGAWPKPEGAAGIGWEVPRADVLATIREAFGRYDVVRAYFDPHEWRTDIDDLAAEFGERVVAWATTRDTAMGAALDRLHADLMNGETFHDDDPLALEHYGNVYVRHKGSLRLVRKEYPNSPRKIDSVVGDALAYEARADALAAGWGQKQSHLTRVSGRVRSY